jgi:hypothetical protein
MKAQIINSPTLPDTLNARRAHLESLLKVMDFRSGKLTVLQNLTISSIKAEIVFIEHQLKKRR